eukprot:TRINITY_DN8073_c0_g1_i1.p1 TRINITY_DN8073_c0_g1~~TRINITY_DN8073_c0_g1_i1.p1  ORF type:complete len:490 (+),score=94.40 TRINITY_DN8073_c0_g1_i1:23-1492(+)
MLCTLTGELVRQPVVTPGGILYDRETIEKHIKQHGTCPITNEPLSAEDLIPVQFPNTEAVQPRKLHGDSLPALLKQFQTEHDSVLFERHTLCAEIEKVRLELSQALYTNEAACRVIARLLRDRDTARAEIEQIQRVIGRPREEMSFLPGLDLEARNKITQKHLELSTLRKQRIISPTLTTIELLKSYRQTDSFPPHQAARPGILCLDIHPVHVELALTGGVDKTAVIFDQHLGKKVTTLTGHKKTVTSTLFHPSEEVVITGSSDSQVWIWASTSQSRSVYKTVHQITIHTNEIVGCSLNATYDYLVTASRDATWAFHNIRTGQSMLQVTDPKKSPITCVMFHPDGLIFATGTENAEVRIWDIKSQKNVFNFEPKHEDAITDLCFSENGFYLATAGKDNILKLWDLRGPKDIDSLKMDAVVQKLRYDESGKYLAVATGTEIRIFTGKHLEHVHTLDEHTGPVTDVKFGKDASMLASVSMDRTLKFWGPKL